MDERSKGNAGLSTSARIFLKSKDVDGYAKKMQGYSPRLKSSNTPLNARPGPD